MSMCRNEEMNKSKSYPKSCPTCKWLGVCARGVKPDPASGIEPKYYIGYKEESVDKYAVIIEKSYTQEAYSSHGPRDYDTIKYDTVNYFENEAALITWLKQQKDRVYGAENIKKVIKYQELSVETEVIVKLK